MDQGAVRWPPKVDLVDFHNSKAPRAPPRSRPAKHGVVFERWGVLWVGNSVWNSDVERNSDVW